jgi:hypothetical protein
MLTSTTAAFIGNVVLAMISLLLYEWDHNMALHEVEE